MNNDNMLEKLTEVFQLFEEFNKQGFLENYGNLNINEVHAISFIGRTEFANVTKTTEFLKITKGAVTKITKKLILNEYLSVYQTEANKKEKYFKLTEKGQVIFDKHEKLHENAWQKDKKIFDQFDDDDKNVIYKFLEVIKDDFDGKLK